MRHTYDATGLLKDSGLVAATAAGTIGGVPKIYDAGYARLDAVAVLDVAAIEVGTGDESFIVLIQGSSDPAFASDVVNLAQAQFGHISTFPGGASTQPTAGRYEVGVWNEVNGRLYRYIRVYTVVAGTIATGINYKVFLATDDI